MNFNTTLDGMMSPASAVKRHMKTPKLGPNPIAVSERMKLIASAAARPVDKSLRKLLDRAEVLDVLAIAPNDVEKLEAFERTWETLTAGYTKFHEQHVDDYTMTVPMQGRHRTIHISCMMDKVENPESGKAELSNLRILAKHLGHLRTLVGYKSELGR